MHDSRLRARAAVGAVGLALLATSACTQPAAPSASPDASGRPTASAASAPAAAQSTAGATRPAGSASAAAPAASPSLASASSSAVGSASPAAANSPVSLEPAPQRVAWEGPSVQLTGTVAIVNLGADEHTAALVKKLVEDAGGTIVAANANPSARVIIGVGNEASAKLPTGVSVPTQAEGYALATSDKTVVAVGRDTGGAFYAAQTLRQLTVDGVTRGVKITDWPLMPVRGVVEGFYGQPWTHEARLDMVEFFGDNKLNTYIYTPKDDPYLRAKWRDLYPANDLSRLRELTGAAKAQHVDFVFALSPGNDICYSSDADYKATVAKFDQLRAMGVTSFYVALDDIAEEPQCDADKTKFGTTKEALVKAQSAYLNRIQANYVKPNRLDDLTMVPTEYTGSEASAAKKAQADTLDPAIKVQWTGEGIVNDEITAEQAKQAATSYGTKHLVIWENYPVNDGEQEGQIFFSPLPGRAKNLYQEIDGLTSNPLIQAYASMPALATVASYTWNPGQSTDDEPNFNGESSQAAALRRIVGAGAGAKWNAMRAFVDVNTSWPFSGDLPKSAGLTADIDAFERALAGTDSAAVTKAAATLRARLDLLAGAPQSLKSIAVTGFYNDCLPWLQAGSDWARAGKAAIDVRLAMRAGNKEAAAKARETMTAAATSAKKPRVSTVSDDGTLTIIKNSVVPRIGDGQFERLVNGAEKAYQG